MANVIVCNLSHWGESNPRPIPYQGIAIWSTGPERAVCTSKPQWHMSATAIFVLVLIYFYVKTDILMIVPKILLIIIPIDSFVNKELTDMSMT